MGRNKTGWEAAFFNPRVIQAVIERRAVVTAEADISIGPSFEHEGLFQVTMFAKFAGREGIASSACFQAELLSDLGRALYGSEFQDYGISAEKKPSVLKRVSHSILNADGDQLTLEVAGVSPVLGQRGVKIILVEQDGNTVAILTTARAVKNMLDGIDGFTRTVSYRKDERPEDVPKCDGDHALPLCADPECWLTE